MSIVNSNNFLHKTVDGVKQFFSPLVNAATVVRMDGTRLEQEGTVSADKLQGKAWSEMMLEIYPVGSIYMSVNSTSPASLFGGTWEQLQDRFLLGAGNSYALGNTGGNETTTLIASNFPGGAVVLAENNTGGDITIPGFTESSMTVANGKWPAASVNNLANAGLMQRNVPINNMPPYLAVNMWKRVS